MPFDTAQDRLLYIMLLYISTNGLSPASPMPVIAQESVRPDACPELVEGYRRVSGFLGGSTAEFRITYLFEKWCWIAYLVANARQ